MNENNLIKRKEISKKALLEAEKGEDLERNFIAQRIWVRRAD